MKTRFVILLSLLLLTSCSLHPYLRLSEDYLNTESDEHKAAFKQGLYRVEEKYMHSRNNIDFKKIDTSLYRFFAFEKNFVAITVLFRSPDVNVSLLESFKKFNHKAGKYNVNGTDIELTVFGALDFNTWNGFYVGEILSDTTLILNYQTFDSIQDTFYYKDYVLELVDSTYRVPNIERIDEWEVKKRKK